MAAYYDLGAHTRPVSTTSPEAQTWFDRGLVWCYGFNHEEAIRCFERAAECDPGLAMAHWGIAYAIGPNYNKAWDAFEEEELVDAVARAYAEIARAVALAETATPVEQAIIAALARRFQTTAPAADPAVWDAAYADAMRDVYRRFGDDLDVAALFAEALITRTPWLLWDLDTRPAGCRRRHRGGGRGARGGDRAARPAAPRPAAPVRAHDGDVAALRSARCRPRTTCATSFPTPGTWCTWRRTSTCSAACTATSWSRTTARSWPTASTWSGRARSTSTACTGATTTTSSSTARCSSASSSRP